MPTDKKQKKAPYRKSRIGMFVFLYRMCASVDGFSHKNILSVLFAKKRTLRKLCILLRMDGPLSAEELVMLLRVEPALFPARQRNILDLYVSHHAALKRAVSHYSLASEHMVNLLSELNSFANILRLVNRCGINYGNAARNPERFAAVLRLMEITGTTQQYPHAISHVESLRETASLVGAFNYPTHVAHIAAIHDRLRDTDGAYFHPEALNIGGTLSDGWL